MQYRLLGQSGLAVSELCLGTMTFGNTTDEQQSNRMIDQFLDAGGNFLDTADVYVSGRSEEIVGKAIQAKRSEVILATKVRFPTASHVNGAGLSRKHILDGVEASLKRLGTDYIDLYQVHTWDKATPIEETLRALDDLVTSGKVRYIGCSNFFAWHLMKSLAVSEAKRYVRFVAIQQQYSLVSREMDRELLELCVEENVGVIPWAPIGGGFLTDRYGYELPTEGRLANPNGGESSWAVRGTERNLAIRDAVRQTAKELERTTAQVALRWLIQREGIISPIFGARTLEQFEDNMGAIGWEMSAESWNKLDEVSALPSEYPNRFIHKFSRGLK
ncbi:aldo/keto reductase [Paenibacillus curdlanolyticus YK9]|uniref:Aldo/keto reductase n=1 Tax=Paenibacillus curdlanolyticus YK9 TaxID=717606 RepID=E0I538_9BACL|nr:aldo/keto reductase [Paenibacillus curdlanolyticus]EFM12080.1 aldo/keto reductase [Paenibacillus curdlanolyticus YK9]